MFLKYNIFNLLWTAFVLTVSVVGGKTLPDSDILGLDKFIHVTLYGVMALTWTVGLLKQYSYPELRFNAKSYVFGGCVGLGVLTEFLQTLIPGRHFELYDMLANALGAGLGVLLFVLVYRR